uniref:Uncharacterized protein n=1 Tax=Anguilla anguilla TaxID=7936 RepID=A0A0E9SLZ0_ANGAN
MLLDIKIKPHTQPLITIFCVYSKMRMMKIN